MGFGKLLGAGLVLIVVLSAAESLGRRTAWGLAALIVGGGLFYYLRNPANGKIFSNTVTQLQGWING